MYSRAKKVDSTQAEVVRELRGLGYLVKSTAEVGRGWPDAVACLPFSGNLWLIEIKAAKGKLLQSQIDLQASGWPVVVLRSAADVIEFDRGVRRSMKPGKLNRPWP